MNKKIFKDRKNPNKGTYKIKAKYRVQLKESKKVEEESEPNKLKRGKKEEVDIKEGSVTNKRPIFKDGKLFIDAQEMRKLMVKRKKEKKVKIKKR